jgi:two-component system alkaline phosphatase synthesis response regulator PhoP
MSENPRRVLVVEDDDSMVIALRDGLVFEGFEVSVARDGEAGLRAAVETQPQIVILDVMLPRKSGLDVCRELRGRGLEMPILMLTSRGQEIDKVIGLKMGADDYLTKPFGFLELVARIEALLRRTSGARSSGSEPHQFGDLVVDFRAGEVRRGVHKLDLSARELRLLRYFVEHRGEILSRDQLLTAVWDYDDPPLTRTVDMHVAKLRKKLEVGSSEPSLIATVHRQGYKFTG